MRVSRAKKLIVKADGVNGLYPLLHGHLSDEGPALAGSMPVCSSCSIRATEAADAAAVHVVAVDGLFPVRR